MELSTSITKDEYKPSYSRKITHDELRELGARSDWDELADSDLEDFVIS